MVTRVLKLIPYDKVDSTMDLGGAALGDRNFNALDLLAISAKIQTSGRGREGRQWVSAPGNVHVSFCFKLEKYIPAVIYQLSFLGAVALNRTLSPLLPSLRVQNKWPNDIFVDGQKIAGILIETYPESTGIVMGMGINVDTCPGGVMYPTTSLKEYQMVISPQDLIYKVGHQLNNLLDQWENQGFEKIIQEWKSKIWGLKEEIKLKSRGRQINGILYDVDDQGFLLVKEPNGPVHIITAGDIILKQKEIN